MSNDNRLYPFEPNSISQELSQDLSKTDSLETGLVVLENHLKPYGVCGLVYGFMIHEKSHLRSDLVWCMTFTEELRRTAKQDGGAITYRFGDVVPKLTEPLFFDLEAILAGEGLMYSHNETYVVGQKIGYTYGWIIPFSGEVQCGIGFLMAMQDIESGAPKMDVNQIIGFGAFFHKAMIKHKQMAKHFNLTRAQSEALASAAQGKTAAHLAAELGLTERSVELRVQKAREKLRAKTTVEAVYKALAYGILPL